MMLSAPPASLDAIIAEKEALDGRLDEALRAFAAFEEQMNHRWHEADPATRQHLLAERTKVEDSLGIVSLIERLDQIRDLLLRLRG